MLKYKYILLYMDTKCIHLHTAEPMSTYPHPYMHTHTHPCVYRQNRQAVQTNTQAGWQAGKEDRRMHTLIVIQTHALFVGAQTDKHTGRLAGRQGRRTYAYTDSDTDTDTRTACQCTDRQTHRLAGRQAGKTDVNVQ